MQYFTQVAAGCIGASRPATNWRVLKVLVLTLTHVNFSWCKRQNSSTCWEGSCGVALTRKAIELRSQTVSLLLQRLLVVKQPVLAL